MGEGAELGGRLLGQWLCLLQGTRAVEGLGTYGWAFTWGQKRFGFESRLPCLATEPQRASFISSTGHTLPLSFVDIRELQEKTYQFLCILTAMFISCTGL